MTNTASVLASDDSYQLILKQLLNEMCSIRKSVVENAAYRLAKYSTLYRSGVFTKSAINLAQYLALRQFDLRHLQLRLAQLGLSSLGRAEASVLSTLDAVIDILRRATEPGYVSDGKNPSEYGFSRGQQLLDQHTIELFGPYFEKSKAHVMVTLGTEAAWDYQLICELLQKGMTCARINCAHDQTSIWQAMIRNVRRAEAESGRRCRILMDLAGHKIRTGAIQLGPAIHHIKIKCNAYGKCIKPGRLILYNTALPAKPAVDTETVEFKIGLSDDFFRQLTVGSELAFTDVRGKARKLIVETILADGELQVCCEQSSYLESGTELTLFNPAEDSEQSVGTGRLGSFSGQAQTILLFKDDLLLLTEHSIEGAPAEYDKEGAIIKPAYIGCTLNEVVSRLTVGDPVWIDDGKLGAEVTAINEDGALLRVTRAGTRGVKIMSDKGINFPATNLALPPLSEKDLEDLDFVCEHADLVGFSFVESQADMEYLIEELAKRSATDLPIIAKIETNRAVKNMPEIILGTIGRHSLGIMIARGDLAVELGSARLAEIQEELLWLCEAAHVPVIWATQVLESIAKKGTKSRPEFTDAAMAVRAECVMLNKGPYVVDALSALVNVMIRMQEHQHKKFPRLRALHW
ncbi:pyruvate kinase [Methylomonas sp. AM2-LC]|uniref:pyruvate kinase n=1 Tax=Methylomonas sp. AM2-LC TaxID=3153301 RepID=UPI003265B4E5